MNLNYKDRVTKLFVIEISQGMHRKLFFILQVIKSYTEDFNHDRFEMNFVVGSLKNFKDLNRILNDFDRKNV